MLRLWRDRLRIALTPERIVLVRRTAGWRPRTLQKADLPVIHHHGVPAWQAPANRLAEYLAADKIARHTAVSLVLSNSFVRYRIMPWSAEISSAPEQAAYFRMGFVQAYGEKAQSWNIVACQSSANSSWIACAVDQDLIQSARAAVSAAGAKLKSIQPHLMSAFNAARKHIKHTDVWFVQVEKQRLLAALLLDGQWRAITGCVIAGTDWQTQLIPLLEREYRLLGIEKATQRIYLSSADVSPLPLRLPGSWSAQWLPAGGITDSEMALVMQRAN